MQSVPNLFPTTIPADGIVRVAMIGEAGRELERWIKPFFIRSQCFLGNVCQERPPDNKLQEFFSDTSCRNPSDRLQGWINVLAADLQKVQPNIIIALGRHPTYILTGREANWTRDGEFTWGSILPCTLVPGLKVIPVPHPSYIMRGLFDLRPLVRVWLKRAKANSLFPEIRRPYRELVVDPTLEQVMFELDRLVYAPELAFDIETVPGKKVTYRNDAKGLLFTADVITCISFSDRPDWSISIPFSRGPGIHRWSVDIEMQIWKAISRLLGQPGPLKIAHNLMFDFLELAARKVFVAGPRWDTMAGHNRAYLDLTKKKLKKHSLNRLSVCTSLYTEEPFYKNDWKDQNKGEKWEKVSNAFWKYNAMDSAVLHEIKAAEERDLDQMGMLEMFKREMRAFDPLAAAALQGTKRNLGIVNELAHFLENNEGTGKVQVLQRELDSVVGYKLNTKSSQQMVKFLYSNMGFPIQFNKHTKRPTADEGALAKLYQKTKHPILLRIKELTRLRGFQSNYIDSAISIDGRSRTTYNQARTSTARISSSDALIGEGKNLQTIPSRPRPGEDDYNRLIKDYKKSFVADEGKLLAKRDYAQAEAMVVAWLAEDLQQMDDFLHGADIHCRTVQILYDCDYQEALDGYRNKDPQWTLRRNVLAKPTRHGFNYRLGPRQLSQMFALAGFDVPEAECRRMLQAMASGVPSVVRWQQEVEEQLKSTRSITNAFGLRRTFFGIIDDDAVREAIAFNPQSTVGQLMNFALERVYHESSVMTDLDILLQIHDAVIWQSSTDKVQTHAAIVGELMDIPLEIKGRKLVVPSDLEVGPSWGELSKPKWET
jgi:DNA polymerase I-like protein with 3'-5' exonuclease and polymerase domains/uracil-DNA glycosylase